MNMSRRRVLVAGALAALMPLALRAQQPANHKMKIGVIGSGRLGGTVGGLWAKAGHQVMFSGLDIGEVKQFVSGLGAANVSAGTPEEAARFGEVLLTAVPYAALPQLGRDLGPILKGKIVLDASNPVPSRDGDIAKAARARGGAGLASAEYLSGARVVRAFNSVNFALLQKAAHRQGEKIAIPIAGDDAEGVKVAVQLVQDAGFEPVVVGGLARAKDFDPGTAVYGKGLTAAELKRGLGM